MTLEIKTITAHFIFNNYVNCYLIRTGDGYILIDTGMSNKRGVIEKELESAGCQPGNLKLIVLTHGDFDHTGNAAYLRKKFGTRIAMNYNDFGMAERGDMFWNRKNPNIVIRIIFDLFFGLSKYYSDDNIGVLSIPEHVSAFCHSKIPGPAGFFFFWVAWTLKWMMDKSSITGTG